MLAFYLLCSSVAFGSATAATATIGDDFDKAEISTVFSRMSVTSTSKAAAHLHILDGTINYQPSRIPFLDENQSTPYYKPDGLGLALRGEERVFKTEGTDGRTMVRETHNWPFSAIVQVRSHFSDGTLLNGTGVMVGPYHVLTVGHLGHGDSGWTKGIEIRPGLNGTAEPFGMLQASRVYCFPEWLNVSKRNLDYNLALVVLGQEVGKTTGWFGMMGDDDDDRALELPVRISGYPESKGGGKTMWSMDGQITEHTPDSLCYRIDVSKGQEGGPIWYNAGEMVQVLGIHTHDDMQQNAGAKLSGRKLEKLCQWIQETWSIGNAESVDPGKDDDFALGLQAFEEQKYKLALHHFDLSSKRGNPAAWNYLGVMNELGYGTCVDMKHAFECWTKAVEGNDPKACCNLGDYYVNKEDFPKAAIWFKRGADLGNKVAADNFELWKEHLPATEEKK